ncbi:MAG: hypothetical protein J1F33_01865 [Clostridiales bacterium]|nr:hypothetical protein [Clostridiales bacterium]
MTNNLNEKKGMIISVSIIVSLLFALAVLTVGMVFAVRIKIIEDGKKQPQMSTQLLVDASAGLKGKASALRLCNNEETADKVMEEALVYAVRAETALECDHGVWSECRAKEAFLNDACALLSGKTSEAMKKSDLLYAYSSALLDSLNNSSEFEYNGELIDVKSDGEFDEPTDDDIEKAKAKIEEILSADGAEYSGAYHGKISFEIKSGARHGYAIVKGDKICEFALSGAENAEGDKSGAEEKGAEALALNAAEKCGFDGLSVYSVFEVGNVTTVKMCHEIDGAACRDECASATVEGGEVIGFTAGECEHTHSLPTVKVSETDARKNSGSKSEGRLVTTFDGTRDRVCYEYVIECEDGVHYVYVCAENGNQMQIR